MCTLEVITKKNCLIMCWGSVWCVHQAGKYDTYWLPELDLATWACLDRTSTCFLICAMQWFLFSSQISISMGILTLKATTSDAQCINSNLFDRSVDMLCYILFCLFFWILYLIVRGRFMGDASTTPPPKRDYGRVEHMVKSKGTRMDWQNLIPLQLYLPVV